MRVAAINWEITPGTTLADFRRTIDSAAAQGAELVVLPEFAYLSLLPGEGDRRPSETVAWGIRFAEAEWVPMLREVAVSSGVTIVGGSHFAKLEGRTFNVCPVLLPNGAVEFGSKCRMTRFEKEDWGVEAGSTLLYLKSLRLGVAICYDCEFPEAIRALAEAGSEVIAVPAFTETQRGFQRVRWCAQARAVENQVFVIHASLTGSLGGEPVPSGFGSSAILCPSHDPFPLNAILAETECNRHGTAIADLDFHDLNRCRSAGDVQNWRDRHPSDWKVRIV